MRLCAALLGAALALNAQAADVYIGVGGAGQGEKIALALPPLAAVEPRRGGDSLLASKTRDVLRSDLLFSRWFDVVSEGPAVAGLTPEGVVSEWKALGRAVVTGKASDVDGFWSLELTLHDAASGKSLFDRHYAGQGEDWRGAAHDFADRLTEQLTGRPGIARSRIAFSNNESGFKEIYVADYDGARLRRLTKDRSIALLPRWSKDGTSIYYTSYKANNPDLYRIPASGGEARRLLSRDGLNIAGGASPDGTKLLVTQTKGDATNVFELSLADMRTSPVTSHRGIDTSPTYSPDGRQIAFVSDRSGNPQIFVMDTATGRAKQLTRLNWCDSPAWSPTGEFIAFAGRYQSKARIHIFLVDLTGEKLRQLTEGAGDNEDPSWSPDGRFIAFTKALQGRSRIYVMDADGSAPHLLLDVPANSTTSHWSP